MNLVSMSTKCRFLHVFMLQIPNYLICVKDGKINGPVKHGPTKDESFITVGKIYARSGYAKI